MTWVRKRVARLLKALAVVLAVFFRKRSEPDRMPEPESPTRELETGEDPRATAAVAALLGAAALALAGFTLFYVVFPDTQLLGLCLGGGLVLVGVALAVAGNGVVPQEKAESEYHEFGDPVEQEQFRLTVEKGGVGISRRKLLAAAGGAVAVAGGAAALAPLASLGPSPGRRLFETPWRPGRSVVGPDDEPLLASDIEEAAMLTGFPAAASRESFGAPVIIVRLPEDELDMPPERLAGAPEGIIAFSRICPHAGCAVSMYRHPKLEANQPAPALVCPCHYSTFDPRSGGTLEFGPAGRDLPQLPLRINDAGELEAAGDFFDPVGPSYGGVRRGEPGEEQQQ